MPSEPPILISLAVGAIIVLWLVFFVLKKLFGLALIAAIIGAIALLWFNPGLATQIWTQAQSLLGPT